MSTIQYLVMVMSEKDYRSYKNAIARELEVMQLFLLGELELTYKDYELCEQSLYFLKREIKRGKR